MPNTQKKFLKKKEREKKVKVKMAHRRETIRKEAKEKREEEMRMEAEFELRNGKPEPILNDPEAIAQREARKKAKVQERLSRNLAILEALEKEFDEEHEEKERLQERLEAEGHKSVKDKLAALHAKAKELQSMTAALEEYSKPDHDLVEREKAALANQQAAKTATCWSIKGGGEPVAEGYTPQRVLDSKIAEEVVREELSS